eukprot:scaffold82379_cov30-Tisochrysis_lutea.AAC.3
MQQPRGVVLQARLAHLSRLSAEPACRSHLRCPLWKTSSHSSGVRCGTPGRLMLAIEMCSVATSDPGSSHGTKQDGMVRTVDGLRNARIAALLRR